MTLSTESHMTLNDDAEPSARLWLAGLRSLERGPEWVDRAASMSAEELADEVWLAAGELRAEVRPSAELLADEAGLDRVELGDAPAAPVSGAAAVAACESLVATLAAAVAEEDGAR